MLGRLTSRFILALAFPLLFQGCVPTGEYLAAGPLETNTFALHIPTAEDRRADPTRLVVMTFNAEFLWDGVPPEEGSAGFPWKNSQVEAEEHMQAVADIINRSSPDIINLVEVENLEALTVLNDKFLAGRGYKPYFKKGKDTSTGQDVVLLSRVDPEGGAIDREDATATKSGVTKGVSKNYFAKFTVSGKKIALVGLHFLAFPTHAQRAREREAQAEVIRLRAVALKSEGYEVIVLGDFNDYDGETLDHQDSRPVSRVLETVRSLEAGPADDLVNAASFVTKPNRYTAHWDQDGDDVVDFPKELTSIDHVLLSPGLVQRVDHVEFPHHHNPVLHPDHFPIVVHLKLADTPVGALRIVRLLPNPVGDDSLAEEVSLKNTSNQPIAVAGWKLRDAANTVWDLTSLGIIAAGETKVIKRTGGMSLNNSGDTVDLLNQAGTVLQTVVYGRVDEGEEHLVPE